MALWEQRLCRRGSDAASRATAIRRAAAASGEQRPRGRAVRACAPRPIGSRSASRRPRSRGGTARRPRWGWRRTPQRPRAWPSGRPIAEASCEYVTVVPALDLAQRRPHLALEHRAAHVERERAAARGIRAVRRVDQLDHRLDPRAVLALGLLDGRAREATSDLLGEFGVGLAESDEAHATVGGRDHQATERGVGERVADRLARRPTPGLGRRHAEQVVGALVDAARRAEAGSRDGRRDVGAVGELPAEPVCSAGVEVGMRGEPDRGDERAAQVPGRDVRGAPRARRARAGASRSRRRRRWRARTRRRRRRWARTAPRAGSSAVGNRSLAVYGAPPARFHPNSAHSRHAPRYDGGHGELRGRNPATRCPKGGEPVVRSNYIAALVLTVSTHVEAAPHRTAAFRGASLAPHSQTLERAIAKNVAVPRVSDGRRAPETGPSLLLGDCAAQRCVDAVYERIHRQRWFACCYAPRCEKPTRSINRPSGRDSFEKSDLDEVSSSLYRDGCVCCGHSAGGDCAWAQYGSGPERARGFLLRCAAWVPRGGLHGIVTA